MMRAFHKRLVSSLSASLSSLSSSTSSLSSSTSSSLVSNTCIQLNRQCLHYYHTSKSRYNHDHDHDHDHHNDDNGIKLRWIKRNGTEEVAIIIKLLLSLLMLLIRYHMQRKDRCYLEQHRQQE